MEGTNTKQNKYFKVIVERGHCGSGNGFESAFYFATETAFQAMQKARSMPSVKHHKLPLSVKEITEEEYAEHRQTSSYHTEGQHMVSAMKRRKKKK